MKEGWEYKKLGDVCDTINGLWKGKKEPFVKVGVIRNANFTKSFTLNFDNIEYLDVEERQYRTRKLFKGDLIVEKSGGSEKQPVGRTVLFNKEDGEYSFSNFTSVLRIKESVKVQSEFLYKYLLFVYKRGDTKKMQKATTGIHNIEFDKFLAIPIPVLTQEEQQAIVSRLDAAFAKIDALKANAEKQLNDARALFQAELSESMMPKEGWEEKTLKELGQTQTGTTPSKSDKANYGNYMEFIRPSEIDYDGNGGIDYNCEMKLSKQGASKGRIFLSNSVFMVCIGATIGKVGYSTKDVSCNQQINVFTPKDEIIYKFAYYAMRTPSFQHRVIKEGTSSQATLPIINKGKWEQLYICFPDIEEQQQIVAHLDALSAKVKELEKINEQTQKECDALKQAMLREIFE